MYAHSHWATPRGASPRVVTPKDQAKWRLHEGQCSAVCNYHWREHAAAPRQHLVNGDVCCIGIVQCGTSSTEEAAASNIPIAASVRDLFWKRGVQKWSISLALLRSSNEQGEDVLIDRGVSWRTLQSWRRVGPT